MRNKIIGGLAALVVVAGGVLVYQGADDTQTRKASIGQGQNQPPADKAADAQKIMDAKAREAGNPEPGKAGRVKKLPPGEGPSLEQHPPRTCDPSLPPNVEIMWAKQPRNLNEAKGISSRIVVGTVEELRQLPPVVHEHPGEPGGKLETPVQEVTLKVDQSIKGGAKAGERQAIVRAGDAEGCYRVEGDPAYKPGEQYLLLLEESGPGKPPHVISPAGRFKVTGPERALQAFERNPTASEVAGQKLDAVLARLKG